MVQLTVTDEVGKSAGQLELSELAFGKTFNAPLVHQVVVAFQAGQRRGTRAQKNRAAVRGGSAKPWRQKGTGRARAGSIRSPIFRGGGVIFAATPTDFSQKVNRKMYRGALRSIWSELYRQDRLIIVDKLHINKPNTKSLAAKLTKLDARKSLILLDKYDDNIALSARNLAAVEVRLHTQVDPLVLIRYEKILVTTDAIKQIDAALQ